VDFGSGGGFGYGAPIGGSAGGGAIRLNVSGELTVDGLLSAEGQAGAQDNSGGGSGGSIWVNAGLLAGGGEVAADGGEGELYGGGGGAGGRIALYTLTNAFYGRTSAAGGGGDFSGASGTVVVSNGVPPLMVLSNSPNGTVTNGVSSLVLYFNNAPNPNWVPNNVSLTNPNGPVSSGSMSVSMLSSASYLVSFPLQTAVGAYTVGASAQIQDLYGRSMSPAYAGTFSVSLPVIQGTITDASGNPIPGVTLQPSITMSSTSTDTNGNYALGFQPGTSFTVTPSLGALLFAPPSMSYSGLTASVSNQNYTGVPTLATTVAAGISSVNAVIGWMGLSGVNYQVYCSPDLLNWQPWGGIIGGTNGPIQMLIPLSTNSQQFFKVQSGM
jgi:hypothetical protein